MNKAQKMVTALVSSRQTLTVLCVPALLLTYFRALSSDFCLNTMENSAVLLISEGNFLSMSDCSYVHLTGRKGKKQGLVTGPLQRPLMEV